MYSSSHHKSSKTRLKKSRQFVGSIDITDHHYLLQPIDFFIYYLYTIGELSLIISKFMTAIIMKVNDRIPKELDIIQEEEGLGNRTSTITFLIKYYFLTKKSSLDQSMQIMDKLLDRIDVQKLPSAIEQLKDI